MPRYVALLSLWLRSRPIDIGAAITAVQMDEYREVSEARSTGRDLHRLDVAAFFCRWAIYLTIGYLVVRALV